MKFLGLALKSILDNVLNLLIASLYTFLSFLLFVLFGALFEINFENVYTPMFCFLFVFWLYAMFINR